MLRCAVAPLGVKVFVPTKHMRTAGLNSVCIWSKRCQLVALPCAHFACHRMQSCRVEATWSYDVLC